MSKGFYGIFFIKYLCYYAQYIDIGIGLVGLSGLFLCDVNCG